MSYNDPWDWTQQTPAASPLSGATIQPSQAVVPQGIPEQPGLGDQALQMVEGKAISKGLNAAEDKITPYITEGFDKVKGALFPAAAPAEATAAGIAPEMMSGAAAASEAGLASAAPLAAGAAEAGAMSTIGTAMPYVGAALLAAKMFGIKLF